MGTPRTTLTTVMTMARVFPTFMIGRGLPMGPLRLRMIVKWEGLPKRVNVSARIDEFAANVLRTD
jgi:hypothetical protein